MRGRRSGGAQSVAVMLALVVVVAGCATEPEPEPASAPCPKLVTAPEAVTTPDSAPDDDTDGTLLDAEAYAELLGATDSFLAGLADAGGGTFADYDVGRVLGSVLLNPVFEASGLAASGPNGEEFPAGVGLASLTAEERADWARAGQQVVELFQRELDTWPRIDAALDTSSYGYDILDELSDRIRAHMLLDVAYFEAMLALAECHGTEALAGPEAMTLELCQVSWTGRC